MESYVIQLQNKKIEEEKKIQNINITQTQSQLLQSTQTQSPQSTQSLQSPQTPQSTQVPQSTRPQPLQSTQAPQSTQPQATQPLQLINPFSNLNIPLDHSKTEEFKNISNISLNFGNSNAITNDLIIPKAKKLYEERKESLEKVQIEIKTLINDKSLFYFTKKLFYPTINLKIQQISRDRKQIIKMVQIHLY